MQAAPAARVLARSAQPGSGIRPGRLNGFIEEVIAMKPNSVLAQCALALAAVAAFPVYAQSSAVDMGQTVPDAKAVAEGRRPTGL